MSSSKYLKFSSKKILFLTIIDRLIKRPVKPKNLPVDIGSLKRLSKISLKSESLNS